jgi:2'-5' RNA ligase
MGKKVNSSRSNVKVFYSIGLYFDNETDLLVREVWKKLSDQKQSDYYFQSGNRPHITLAIFSGTDIEKAERLLFQFSQSSPSFSLSFQQIGIFMGPDWTVFWAPVVTRNLLEIHADLHQKFGAFSTFPDFTYYNPEKWIPHCGLAMEIKEYQQIPQILDTCRSLPISHKAQVTEIGLISFRPVHHLFSFPLSGN